MSRARSLARGFAAAVSELEQRGVSRKDVAAALGVEPSTVSRYVSGDRSVPIESLPTVDQLCGQPVGYVLRLAGFVEDVDLPAAIRTAPGLTDRYRGDVLAFYEFCVERSLAASDDTNPDTVESRLRNSSSA